LHGDRRTVADPLGPDSRQMSPGKEFGGEVGRRARRRRPRCHRGEGGVGAGEREAGSERYGEPRTLPPPSRAEWADT
jgi:hypothetical protein